jgi:putative acetyltransferase
MNSDQQKIQLPDLLIREVEKKDNTTLSKIVRCAFEEHNAPQTGTVYADPTTDNLFELFRTDRSILWVAEEKKEVMGLCGVYPTPGLDTDCAELVKFYLLDRARGKGIGSALMLACFDSAKKMGYKKLYLESLPEFSKAISIYQRLGFAELKAPLGSSGHTSCNIWMIKDL